MRISDWSSDVCSSDLLYAHLVSKKGKRYFALLVFVSAAGRTWSGCSLSWSSPEDVSILSDINGLPSILSGRGCRAAAWHRGLRCCRRLQPGQIAPLGTAAPPAKPSAANPHPQGELDGRSEEHTSELQSLMRISYAVFCLQKKQNKRPTHTSSLTLTAN